MSPFNFNFLTKVFTWMVQYIVNQWRIQDFPQEDVPTPKSVIIFQFFSRKLHENERIGNPGGRTSLVPP